jgi:hypothetical protein
MRSASKGDPTAESLEAAVAALTEAAEELSRVNRASPPVAMPAEEQPPAPDPEKEEREAYVRSLQQRGAVVDADDDVDLASLPPTVTHVRFPDGRVQRIGFN